jgi:OOP family OmpA-OmpF porin
MQSRFGRRWMCVAAALGAFLTSSIGVFAEERVRGVITGRGDDGTVAVRTDDSSSLVVVLTDVTTIRRTDGLRELRMTTAELMSGLRVQLEGAYQGTNRFVAQTITFSRADLKMALAIRGALDMTDRRSIDNRQRIDEHSQLLEQQARSLNGQGTHIAAHQDQIRAHEEKIVGTTGALAATNARIANLREFNVISSTTVYFRNGSAGIPRNFIAELEQVAARARTVDGYVIQVQGFASAVGPDALNQRLSTERAEAVAAILLQNGIPPAHMLIPAAMGTSEQVSPNTTAAGQAQNRRAVVTLLQNKGLSEREPDQP